ncbi:MAG TPA: DUF6152 family protein [Candidatus Acidoferrum sp.]|nr:DUF6152 family protein [Candidatus Acidoferrum sp.]
MPSLFARSAALLISLSSVTVVLAHHGFANFDLNTDLTLKGTIAEVALINPHSWIYVNVVNADGSTTKWKCEMRGGTVLRRSGWNSDMFKVGSNVTITGSPDRFEKGTCYLGSIYFANGSKMDRYGQLVEAERKVRKALTLNRLPNGDPDINGDWAAEQVVMTDPRGLTGTLVPLGTADQYKPGEVPAGGRPFQGSRGTPESKSDDPLATTWKRPSLLPLTDAGKAAIKGFDGGSTDNPRLNCQSTNILFDWSFDNPINHIFQNEREIKLTYGLMNMERTIHLDQKNFPAELKPSRTGYSIGHWDKDVLVVETRGFLPGILSADTNTPHSGSMKVTERFRLDVANGALVREFAAQDGVYWTGTYQGSDSVFVSSLPFEKYNCDDRSFHTNQLKKK